MRVTRPSLTPSIALLAVLVVTICCPTQGQGGAATFRDFHDRQGRAIRARLLRVRDEKVTIEREDGKQFTVSFSALSEADQDYIRGLASRDSSSADRGGRSTGTSAGNWPCFRGPTGMGLSKAAGLPVTWSSTQNIAWRRPLPGPGASSPIVIDDRVYVTCHSGYLIPGQPPGRQEDLKRHLIAVQVNDGRVIWDKTVPAALPEQSRIRDHGFAANTPVADEAGVVVFFGKSGVIAFDHTGRQVWKADVGSKTHGWGASASPILYKDMVLVNASVESQSLIALDRQTGREKWRAGNIREAWNTPLVIGSGRGSQVVVATRPKILSFDPDSGNPLWSCNTDISWYMVPSVVEADGVVYALGGRSGVAGLAIRLGGRGDVTASHRMWTSRSGTNVPSPLIHRGHLYWVNDSKGIAFCAEARTGRTVYEEPLERCGQVYASPVLADGHIYYLNRRGRAFVVAAEPRFRLLATNELNDGSIFNASPAVTGNRLLIRSDKHLYCIRK